MLVAQSEFHSYRIWRNILPKRYGSRTSESSVPIYWWIWTIIPPIPPQVHENEKVVKGQTHRISFTLPRIAVTLLLIRKFTVKKERTCCCFRNADGTFTIWISNTFMQGTGPTPSPIPNVWSASNCSTRDTDQIPVFRYSFHPHGLWCPSKRIISYFGVTRLILCVGFTVFYAFFHKSSVALLWQIHHVTVERNFFYFFQNFNETSEYGILSKLPILGTIQE